MKKYRWLSPACAFLVACLAATYVYKACQAGVPTCSSEQSITFP